MIKFIKLFLLLSTSVLLLGCVDKPVVDDVPETTPKTSALIFPPIYDDYLNRNVQDDIFYFVMPDRFNNGNPANDNGSSSVEISRGGFIADSPFGFHGGDIQGLEQKLDYLKNLGVSAIWMTPILRNKAIQAGGYAHHGYWIIDFTQIDPHFGSNDDLKSLINAAHRKGIKVFFDIITNHTADVIKYEECHDPEGNFQNENTCPYKTKQQVANNNKYTPFLPVGTKNLKVPNWLNDPKFYNNQGDSFWQGESAVNGDFVGLDDLNTRLPEVISGMTEIYQNLITEFKPDGFRIDTVKHVDMIFWSQFSPTIVEHAKSQGIPNFHIFGEVYSGDPRVLSSYTTLGKMPSVLDFGFQSAAADVFYRGKSSSVIAQLFENDDYYSDQDSHANLLMNFLGNHDMGRAGFFIEDAGLAQSDSEKLKRSILSHAFMYLSRGVPVIYYGDEQGFTGDGGDIASREDMFPSQVDEYNDNNLIGTHSTTAENNFDQTHPIYIALRELAQLRMQHKALRRGTTFNRYFNSSSNAFAISRVDKSAPFEYLLAFNPSPETQTFTIGATADDYQWLAGDKKLRVHDGMITISLPPLSYSVHKAKTAMRQSQSSTILFSGFERQSGRIRFDYSLADASSLIIPLFEIRTEIKNQKGQYYLVATDSAPPYSAVVTEELIDLYSPPSIRVTLEDPQGNTKTTEFVLPTDQQAVQNEKNISYP
ncbi:alpha-amylase family glycosyl hydrolase [Aliiglaciecola sp. LCG003]|uniref:alpha-amylase family glycosyl hydrolase n=1 Tax=Aliiglaciecola sp. LCG003 TaxID=3053655 RepID=UPI0025727F7B|nr:alpha-amylase family glycosyl hydrolase [Aliiglaciecola sp. LCG003]WJG09824.1 alpha-amylase family glycosyl hydrolase [Aliiglaciecola sp. LCG003]